MSFASQFQGCHFYVTRVLFTSITCDLIWLSQSTCESERESIEFFFDDMESHQGKCRDGHTHWAVDTWPTLTRCRYYQGNWVLSATNLASPPPLPSFLPSFLPYTENQKIIYIYIYIYIIFP